MAKPRIPEAVHAASGSAVTVEQLNVMMSDPKSQMRLDAIGHRARDKKLRPYRCPGCAQSVFPHGPRNVGYGYYWSHFPGQAVCIYEDKQQGRNWQRDVFNGRQEGPHHKRLVDRLVRIAELDAMTEGAVEKGQYQAPNDEDRLEFPMGRYPDVSFTNRGHHFVLEAQLAAISVFAIVGRRRHYDKKGSKLLWVMEGFTPNALRASERDILADQSGILFSVDDDVENEARRQGRFLLRLWQYDRCEDGQLFWKEPKIVSIDEILALPLVKPRHQRFADRYFAQFKGISVYHDALASKTAVADVCRAICDECGIVDTTGISNHELLKLVLVLHSIRTNEVYGSYEPNLKARLNSAFTQATLRAYGLIRIAVKQLRPELDGYEAFERTLQKAQQDLANSDNPKPWGRNSFLGKIQQVLFPDIVLDTPMP